MKIQIEINHPAHVHLFKNFAWEMEKTGHNVLFTTRNKEIAHILLKNLGFNYKSFGKHYKSALGKMWGIIKFDFLLLMVSLRNKPDMFVSMGSIYASHVAWLIRKPHILLQDTEHATFQHMISIPFASAVLNPTCFERKFKKNQIFYKGYHELAYLHPKRFKPDPAILDEMGVKKGERFVIMRFVSWAASHDVGHNGISIENKIRAAKEFSKYAKIFITSEQPLVPELEPYRISIPPEKIHHAMAYSSMLYGESATMASECAVLGVPAIFLDNDGRGYTNEQDKKYGIVFNFKESPDEQDKSINTGIEILKNNDEKGFREKWQTMINDKIDVTAFLVWFAENFPESKKIMKENPDYQNQFKSN